MALFKGAGVALITPFHEDGSVNYEKLTEILEEQIAEGTDDYEEVQAFYEEEPVNSLLYAIAMSQFEQEVGRIRFKESGSWRRKSPAL